ncbi:MAG: RHS repeat-associated core domain-containing protein [Acidobacteria bacterium]|nr:RHS repeat-associated core domain-containing protein [Acidobacteriota bacterium]
MRSSRALKGLGPTLRPAILFLAAACAAQATRGAEEDVRYGYENATLDQVADAPGPPDRVPFETPSPADEVSLSNGNLHLEERLGFAYPLDHGRTLEVLRVYDSERIKVTRVHWEGSFYRALFQGRGWTGVGWSLHFGRLYWDQATQGTAFEERPKLIFVDQHATEHQLEPFPIAAQPLLDWGYVEEQAPPDPECCVGRCHAYACEGKGTGDGCEECLPCCDSLPPRRYHYVLYPDGTRYELEKIVDGKYDRHFDDGHHDYPVNRDRLGWYTTVIRDIAGNEVRIAYWGAENPKYPEAIKTVKLVPANSDPAEIRTVFWSELWDTDDYREGTLRRAHLLSAQGQDLVYEFAYQEFAAKQNDAYGAREQVEVPWLAEVVGAPSLEENAPAWGYEFQPVEASGEADAGEWVSFNMPWMSKRATPLGGIVTYARGQFVLGQAFQDSERPGKHGPIAHDSWVDRREKGVVAASLFPDGEGDGKPRATWRWERQMKGLLSGTSHQLCDIPDYQAQPELNRFRVLRPDGTGSDSRIGLDPCGQDNEGNVVKYDARDSATYRVVEHGSGTLGPLRTTDMEYVATEHVPRPNWPTSYAELLEKRRTTTYHDGDDVCFDGTQSGTTSASVVMDNRDQHNHWRLKRTISEDYLAADLIEYVGYPDSLTSCEQAHNLVEKPADFIVEQGAQRRAVHRDYAPCSDLVDSVRAATTPGPASAPPGEGDWSSWAPEIRGPQATDQVLVRGHDPRGNLQHATFSGPGTYNDGAPGNVYQVAYGSKNGMIVSARIDHPAIDYFAARVDVDGAGFVVASWDPNGVRTDYSYDILGRLTAIVPPAPEWPTGVYYPSLREVRIVRAPSPSPGYEPANRDQSYSGLAFDRLGRLTEEERAIPGHGRLAIRGHRYDEMGREVFVSEWLERQVYDAAPTLHWSGRDSDGDGMEGDYWIEVPRAPDASAWGTVTFFGRPSAVPGEGDNPLRAVADGLGRVHRVRTVDAATADTEYCGTHRQVTEHDIEVWSPSGPVRQSRVTRYYHDGLDRLALVDAPEGADAAYWYDVNGGLEEAHLVPQLPANAFALWKAGREGWVPYQVRRWEYNGIGRVTKTNVPERGAGAVDEWDEVIGGYDPWGNALTLETAEGRERGYMVENSYDPAGRLTRADRVSGAHDALAGAGTFETSPGGWELGIIDGSGQFQAAEPGLPTFWDRVAYGPCVPAPPTGGGAGALYMGQDCGYSAVGAEIQAARLAAPGVDRDDRLSFKYWRHLRQSATPGTGAGKDRFSVWVVPVDEGDGVGGRRVLFSQDDAQPSLVKWLHSGFLRPGDLFAESDWPAGEAKDLYIYLVFEKGDAAATGLGQGLAVDDVQLGHEDREPLVTLWYDLDMCSGTDLDGACSGPAGLPNAYRGRVSRETWFDAGQYAGAREYAYRGLNGRFSGMRQALNWTGLDLEGAGWATVLRVVHDDAGRVSERFAPYPAGTTPAASYRFAFDRDQLDQVTTGAGAPLLGHVAFDAALQPTVLEFANSVSTSLARDRRHRIERISTVGPGPDGVPAPIWDSGTYRFDGAGNIWKIESDDAAQRFSYDLAGRLKQAQVWPQASLSAPVPLETLRFTYDSFGNMLSSTSDAAEPLPGLVWSHTYSRETFAWDPVGEDQRNQVKDEGFSYDADGNAVRFSGKNGAAQPVGALWDERGRLTHFVEGDPWSAAGVPAESYRYDHGGQRWLRTGRDGLPLLTLRDETGAALADFAVRSSNGEPELARHYVQGLGQLLLERVPATEVLGLSATDRAEGATGERLTVAGAGEGSFEVDVRTAAGAYNHVAPVVLDVGGGFEVADDDLAPDTTNYVRIKRQGVPGALESAPVAVLVDSSVTPASANKIRSLSLSRSGTTITLRWGLVAGDGKKTKVYARRVDSGTSYLLTPQALAAGVKSLALGEQALAGPCVEFYATRVGAAESGPTLPVRLPTTDPGLGLGGPGSGGCPDSPGLPPPADGGPRFANSYHVRDHLGNLRLVTADSGAVAIDEHGVAERHDYYPFGIEMRPSGPVGESSRRKFTGHERDEATGLDYMLARYHSPSPGRFLSVDPGFDVQVGDPQSWNSYAYVKADPLNATDPDGKYGRGAGFTNAQWKKFNTAQQKAAIALQKAAAKIDRALATGKGLKSVTKAFERVFGKSSGTAANMSQVSGQLKAMASVLQAGHLSAHVATGMSTAEYVRAGGSPTSLAGVAVNRNDGVYRSDVLVNLGHAGFSIDRDLGSAAIHESAHNVQLPHGKVNGVTAYARGSSEQRQAFRDLPTVDPTAALTNPDHLVEFAW